MVSPAAPPAKRFHICCSSRPWLDEMSSGRDSLSRSREAVDWNDWPWGIADDIIHFLDRSFCIVPDRSYEYRIPIRNDYWSVCRARIELFSDRWWGAW